MFTLGAGIRLSNHNYYDTEILHGFMEESWKKYLFPTFDGLWNKLHSTANLVQGKQYRNHTATWYGPAEYSYTGVVHAKQMMPRTFQTIAMGIQKAMGIDNKYYFNSMLANCYTNKGIAAHSDNESIFKDYGGDIGAVATISFGEPAKVSFINSNINQGDLVVKDDSIYIMPSGQFQFKYKHAVEPMKSGKRISLTFRHIPEERI